MADPISTARPSGVYPRLAVTHEVWRGHSDGPGCTTFSPVVLRVEGVRDGDGWALTLCEATTGIPWAASVLTAGEREDIARRLAMAAGWQEQDRRSA